MGQPLERHSRQDDNLHRRLDEIECIVRDLMSGANNMACGADPGYHAMHSPRIVIDANARAVGPGPFGADAHSLLDGRHSRVSPMGFNGGRAKLVRNLIRKRRQREIHFPADLFADPGWDMMLDLYAAHYERREISVSSLCIAAAVPATTALRWIKTMVNEGYFVRAADPNDGRRIMVCLSDDTRSRLDDYFDNLDD